MGQIPLAQTLARAGLFWDFLRHKLRQLTMVCHNEKTPEKPLFWRLYRGLVRRTKKRGRRDSNPQPLT